MSQRIPKAEPDLNQYKFLPEWGRALYFYTNYACVFQFFNKDNQNNTQNISTEDPSNLELVKESPFKVKNELLIKNTGLEKSDFLKKYNNLAFIGKGYFQDISVINTDNYFVTIFEKLSTTTNYSIYPKGLIFKGEYIFCTFPIYKYKILETIKVGDLISFKGILEGDSDVFSLKKCELL